MKIALITPEFYPLSKSGGLADYAYSISKSLAASGCDVHVITPDYGKQEGGDESVEFNGHAFHLSKSSVGQVQLIALSSNEFFKEKQMYGLENDCTRFAFFSAAASRIAMEGGFDIVHCNDWQSGFVPLLLKERGFSGGTVFTIHNALFQGLCDPSILNELHIPASHFHMDGLEYYGKVSSLKAGIVYSDRLVTVSPTYAAELQKYAFGMEGIIRKHSSKLRGILNGLDYDVWNPAVDPMLPGRFSANDTAGKRICRRFLLREFSLPQAPLPLISFIGRIDRQKGVDLILSSLPLIKERFMLLMLGTGDRELCARIQLEASRNAEIRFVCRYDEAMAHRIYAGSDIFLMPSRFEPCGYGQMIAMRYGTVPVVRNVGGLKDTVTEFNGTTGTGFLFEDERPEAVAEAIDRAIRIHAQREAWQKVVANCMAADHSWERSLPEYLNMYEEMKSKFPEQF